MSKGDKPRPMIVSQKEFNNRWEKVFGKSDKSIKKDYIIGVDIAIGEDVTVMNKKHIPNKETLKSMKKTEKGKGLTEYETVEEMIEDLK